MTMRHSTRMLLATTALVVFGGMSALAQEAQQQVPAQAQTAEQQQMQSGQQELQQALGQAREAIEQENYAQAETDIETARSELEGSPAEGNAEELRVLIDATVEALRNEDYETAQQTLQEAEQIAGQQQATSGEADGTVQAEAQMQMETEVQIQQPAPTVRVTQAEPRITVHVPAPIVTIEMPEPEVTVDMPDPEIEVIMGQPELSVADGNVQMQEGQNAQANVDLQRAEPQVDIQQDEPEVTITRAGSGGGEQEGSTDQQQLAEQNLDETDQERTEQAQSSAPVTLEGEPDTAVDRSIVAEDRAAAQDQVQAEGSLADMTAEEMLGTDVVNEEGNTIASVNDVVFRPGEEDAHFVLGVGGLFGIGERSIALPMSDFETTEDDQLLLRGMTQERLESMPEYDPAEYGQAG